MRYEFTEVLNDLIDYFLLGDIRLLQKFKQENGLSDDLASEFVSNYSADRAVESGIIIPLAGIENYPYTIIFNLAHDTPELLKPESRLQHRCAGYLLQVENQQILLFTWRILQNFTDKEIGLLQEHYCQANLPRIEIENGLYDVEILGGEVLRGEYYEPAFEFVFRKTERAQMTSEVDINHRFTIDSSTY